MIKNDFIERPFYIQKIAPYIDKPIIKIMTGQRRVGKSYILLQTIDFIQKKVKDANVVYVNKEEKAFKEIISDDDLYTYLSERLLTDKKNYVFVDEIQEISNFQNTLRSLFSEQRCDIYCTGSNANMLSGELATYLSGRYIEIPVHGLSYTEFLQFHQLQDSNQNIIKYMKIGGMPYLINLNYDEELSFEYLRNLYSTILLKDVINRKQIRNIDFMERLVKYIADNIGSLFSANNISKYLKSQRQQLPTQMVIDYSLALAQAFFIYKVPRTDLKGLKYFEIGEKYYFEDLGLRNAIVGFDMLTDIGKWMENVVYLHLLRLGYDVSVGKINEVEIDFVAKKLDQKQYFQVCFRFESQETKQREIKSLLSQKDNYPKYIITLDEFAIGQTKEGISIISLNEFLMREG